MMKKYLIGLILIAIFIVNFTKVVYANNEFVSVYSVVYDVRDTGITYVTQNISISNLTSNYYVSEYNLTINSTKIRNIYAQDEEGSLKTIISRTENTTEIKAFFNQKVAGLGKKLNFFLSYESDDIASHNGKIWEVNIPKLTKSDQISEYVVTLKVPRSFGNPTYIYPQTTSKSLFFTKDQLEKNGITITFGSYQIFSYHLTYNLSNPKKAKIITEIALPPQTQYQEIRLDSLTPKPTNVYIDDDGNWMADYILNPQEEISVIASGSAKLFLFPQKELILDNSLKQKYLVPQKYWESNDSKIIDIAKNLKNPKAIYDYVVKTLSYDYKRLTTNADRFGAAKILTIPNNAVCMEFTDLFIALSRATGIPARELDGFAYTNNEKLKPLSLLTDVLHAWPEYWDEEKHIWIPVDPTWENTTSGIDYFNKLDFNHFVFAIKGMNSEVPYPAGSYRKDPDKKDVIVEFGNDWEYQPTIPEIKLESPKKVISGFETKGYATIINNGKTLSNEGILNLKSTPFNILLEEKVKIPALPPFGQYKLPFKIDNNKFFYSGLNKVTADFQGNHTESNIIIRPLIPNFFIGIILFAFILGGIPIIIRIIHKVFTRKIWIK